MTDNDRWQQNEAELNRIHAMTGLDREMHAKHEDELLAEQDAIEWRAGFERPLDSSTRRFSGAQ